MESTFYCVIIAINIRPDYSYISEEQLALYAAASSSNRHSLAEWITIQAGLAVALVESVQYSTLASFPGRSHLQYLIAYSMQIRRGKAWEIWSHAVMSGRQTADTRGVVPDSSNSRFVSNHPWRYE